MFLIVRSLLQLGVYGLLAYFSRLRLVISLSQRACPKYSAQAYSTLTMLTIAHAPKMSPINYIIDSADNIGLFSPSTLETVYLSWLA